MKMRGKRRVTHWLGVIILGLAGAVFLWGCARGWSLPLTDSHSSRQAQTAITIEMLHWEGAPPLTPFNGLGPPWNVPMEFPTYQLLASWLAVFTGGDVVSAGRLASVLGGLAILPALWLLLGRIRLFATERAVVLAGLLVSPLFVHYSRAVLIETWATALAYWWLAAWVEALHRPELERRWLFAATALGVVAALTKVTSFAIVLPAAFVLTVIRSRPLGRVAWYRSGFCTAPGIIAAVLWTRWTDAAKATHPYADFLTSRALAEWNWGTLAQRLDPAWWARWSEHLATIVPLGALGLAATGLLLGTNRLRLAVGLAGLVAVTGPLTFANLYFVHDYYHMAVAPAVMLAVGLGLIALWQRVAKRPVAAAAVLCLGGALWVVETRAYFDGLGQSQVRHRPVPELALLLREVTQPTDTIVVYGREWDPLVTFYAQRRMTSIRGTHETDETAWQASRAALQPNAYTVLVAMDSVAGDLAFVHLRCRELGLLTEPVASTQHADIYVSAAVRDALPAKIAALRAEGRVLPAKPERMPPGETRAEFLTAEWKPVSLTEADTMFSPTRPLPDAVFAKYAPAQMHVGDTPVLHIHPPGGLRFAPLSRERVAELNYGIMPEIWKQERDTDGVRFRAYVRGPDGRDRLLWEDFVQPRSVADDRGELHATFPVPANHQLELRIDAGPDHNPGYDWSYVRRLSLNLADQ